MILIFSAIISSTVFTINMIGTFSETYFASQNRSDEVYDYVYLYENFRIIFLSVKKYNEGSHHLMSDSFNNLTSVNISSASDGYLNKY